MDTPLRSHFFQTRDTNRSLFRPIVPDSEMEEVLLLIGPVLEELETDRYLNLSLELVCKARQLMLTSLTSNNKVFQALWRQERHWLGTKVCDTPDDWLALAGTSWTETTQAALFRRRAIMEYIPFALLPGYLSGEDDEKKQEFTFIHEACNRSCLNNPRELYLLCLEGAFYPHIPPTESVKFGTALITTPHLILTWAYSLYPQYRTPSPYYL